MLTQAIVGLGRVGQQGLSLCWGEGGVSASPRERCLAWERFEINLSLSRFVHVRFPKIYHWKNHGQDQREHKLHRPKPIERITPAQGCLVRSDNVERLCQQSFGIVPRFIHHFREPLARVRRCSRSQAFLGLA